MRRFSGMFLLNAVKRVLRSACCASAFWASECCGGAVWRFFWSEDSGRAMVVAEVRYMLRCSVFPASPQLRVDNGYHSARGQHDFKVNILRSCIWPLWSKRAEKKAQVRSRCPAIFLTLSSFVILPPSPRRHHRCHCHAAMPSVKNFEDA